MAAKRRSQTKKPTGPRGPRGKAGATGPAGPSGPPGENHTNEIALLSAQGADVIRELQTQLTRIDADPILSRNTRLTCSDNFAAWRKNCETSSEGPPFFGSLGERVRGRIEGPPDFLVHWESESAAV
jgi:hypothetical protein